jgi:MFS family permease
MVVAMGIAGFLSGMIMPSRDMLVRAAAPAGAVGRAFGIVSIGLSTGGMIGPMLFGWIMDRGAPQWVFGASVVFMVLTVGMALIGDRRSLVRRRAVMATPRRGRCRVWPQTTRAPAVCHPVPAEKEAMRRTRATLALGEGARAPRRPR